MLMFFSVAGNYLKGSGFEEIILQAKLCTSKRAKVVTNEKLYNRRWLIHEVFGQAVEQLFTEEYLETSSEKVNVSI